MTPFRNLILYRLPADFLATLSPQRLDEALGKAPLRELAGVEVATDGFLPLEQLGGGYTFEHGGRVLFRFGRNKRLLPTQVINRAMDERLDAIRVAENRTVGPKERRRIRDEIFLELIPQAFTLRSATQAVLDFATGWLWIDASSWRVGDALCAALREALGSFPALPAHADLSVRALFTSWLAAAASPHDSRLALGTQCVLADPCEGGARIAARDQEMFCGEVEAHLQAGKQCTRLALQLAGLVDFVLDQSLSATGLRWEEQEQPDDAEGDAAGTAILHLAQLGQLVSTLARELEMGEVP